MSGYKTVGFIGLGVMGEPICRNLVKKSGARVVAFDLAAEPLARLRADGAEIAASVADVIKQSDLFVPVPAQREHVRAVFEGDGILKNIRGGQVVVDLGTSSVSQTRAFAANCRPWARHGPMRRSRGHVRRRRMVRSASWSARPHALHPAIEPLIRCFATDVTHCGDVGAGQVTKILNNMVLFETVNRVRGGRAGKA